MNSEPNTTQITPSDHSLHSAATTANESSPRSFQAGSSGGNGADQDRNASTNDYLSKTEHASAGPFREAEVPSTEDLETNEKDVTPLEPLDGGLQAWLVTAGCWCAFFVTFGWINCIGVFQDFYQSNLLKGYSSSAVAWISSTQTFMMFAGGLIFGKLFDSYGPRYILFMGSFLHVFGLMMTSVSKEYYQVFLAQAVCSAAGASCVYYACAGSITTWFLKMRSTAFGIAASGSSFGGVLIPIMVFRLLPKVGFPWTMRIVAFLILGLLVITNATVKSLLTHTPKPFTITEYVGAFKEIPFTLLVLLMTVFSFGLFLPFNFLIIQAQAEGMSVGLSEYMIPVLMRPGKICQAYLRMNNGQESY